MRRSPWGPKEGGETQPRSRTRWNSGCFIDGMARAVPCAVLISRAPSTSATRSELNGVPPPGSVMGVLPLDFFPPVRLRRPPFRHVAHERLLRLLRERLVGNALLPERGRALLGQAVLGAEVAGVEAHLVFEAQELVEDGVVELGGAFRVE